MTSSLKVTTLCENTVPYPGNGLLGEHGLAMLAEVRGKRFLFDTGGALTLLKTPKPSPLILNSWRQ